MKWEYYAIEHFGAEEVSNKIDELAVLGYRLVSLVSHNTNLVAVMERVAMEDTQHGLAPT